MSQDDNSLDNSFYSDKNPPPLAQEEDYSVTNASLNTSTDMPTVRAVFDDCTFIEELIVHLSTVISNTIDSGQFINNDPSSDSSDTFIATKDYDDNNIHHDNQHRNSGPQMYEAD
mmetsp:Transcript_17009/g.20235  ORF Transcript_17009/g.20235 Transcript_17009/m.20235 type:complete len:115 (+) Transcript_17009:1508-1852(+)